MTFSSLVYKSQYRRVYLTWGFVLLVGFMMTAFGLFDGYLHWYVLSLVGISSQLPFTTRNKKAMWLFIIWLFVSLSGTFRNHIDFNPNLVLFEIPTFVANYAAFWLIAMSVPQIVTGYITRDRFQKILGVVWGVLGIILIPSAIDLFYLFVFVGLVSSIPYFYIATK